MGARSGWKEPGRRLTCVGNDAQGPGYDQADQQRICQGLRICRSLERIAVRLSQVTLKMEAALCNDPCTGTAGSALLSDPLLADPLLVLPPAMRPGCDFDQCHKALPFFYSDISAAAIYADADAGQCAEGTHVHEKLSNL